VSKTALVVDDSATMRDMVSSTLKQAGFEPVTGGNGQEALDKLAALTGRRLDLIITDLNMPVMDGLTFIKAVRTRDEYKSVPILMLTTESHADVKAQGKAAGATGWLVKPFDPEVLLQVISEVVPR
jgi:two-component system chemotaxis response regulator CheY